MVRCNIGAPCRAGFIETDRPNPDPTVAFNEHARHQPGGESKGQ
jgi:hypothetical protein